MTLQVGDRFVVANKVNPFYGQKGEILCTPNNNGIVSVYLNATGTLAQKLSVYDLRKI
jgi:hypothetical protein